MVIKTLIYDLVHMPSLWNNPHLAHSKSKDWNDNMPKTFGTRKPKGINMIALIG